MPRRRRHVQARIDLGPRVVIDPDERVDHAHVTAVAGAVIAEFGLQEGADVLVDLAEQPDARTAHLKIGEAVEATVAIEVLLDKLRESLCTEAQVD